MKNNFNTKSYGKFQCYLRNFSSKLKSNKQLKRWHLKYRPNTIEKKRPQSHDFENDWNKFYFDNYCSESLWSFTQVGPIVHIWWKPDMRMCLIIYVIKSVSQGVILSSFIWVDCLEILWTSVRFSIPMVSKQPCWSCSGMRQTSVTTGFQN